MSAGRPEFTTHPHHQLKGKTMELTKIETADGDRGNRSFPASWGVPPDGQFSAERAAWVARHIHNAPRAARNSAEAALRKAQALAGSNRSHERNARLALHRDESVARDSAAALRYANHLALRAGPPADR
jgi:hypothetical protein